MKIKKLITKKNLEKLEDSIISEMGLFELVDIGGKKYCIIFLMDIIKKFKKFHRRNKHLTLTDRFTLFILMDTFNIQEVQI